MSDFSEELLKEAYLHYSSTGDLTYSTIPLNGDYFKSVYHAAQNLYHDGYIDDLSDGLLYATDVTVAPIPDKLSFSITTSGIEKVRGW